MAHGPRIVVSRVPDPLLVLRAHKMGRRVHLDRSIASKPRHHERMQTVVLKFMLHVVVIRSDVYLDIRQDGHLQVTGMLTTVYVSQAASFSVMIVPAHVRRPLTTSTVGEQGDWRWEKEISMPWLRPHGFNAAQLARKDRLLPTEAPANFVSSLNDSQFIRSSQVIFHAKTLVYRYRSCIPIRIGRPRSDTTEGGWQCCQPYKPRLASLSLTPIFALTIISTVVHSTIQPCSPYSHSSSLSFSTSGSSPPPSLPPSL
ncbi:hypothetical protein EVG20_g11433, partial [Dentipellis fragilis]